MISYWSRHRWVHGLLRNRRPIILRHSKEAGVKRGMNRRLSKKREKGHTSISLCRLLMNSGTCLSTREITIIRRALTSSKLDGMRLCISVFSLGALRERSFPSSKFSSYIHHTYPLSSNYVASINFRRHHVISLVLTSSIAI